ncbi:hypothetical protein C8A05DRAFT_42843 [Staphylotrichum tortipilum]|uniref:SAP domain-containing protein n=1 Tax=Staphylotrichum tortipilum TaxID=2831512 RepID=A0AAN6MNA2_9PEZI|nr:hypothetical protein C8A05DRAFT_42843 [Staphylotrichum longicolle]
MATDFSRLTVIELRQELKRRNLSQTGKKADLVDRLTTYELDQPDQSGRPDQPDQPDQSREPDEPVAEDSEDPVVDPSDALGAPSEQSAAEPQPDTDSTTGNADALPGESAPDSASIQTPLTGAAAPAAEATTETEPIPATEIITDAASRKRRSRSPPPENEAFRKRARASSQTGDEYASESLGVASQPTSQDQSGAQPTPAAQTATDSYAATREPSQHNQDDGYASHKDQPAEPVDEPMTDYDRDVAPAQHLATSALYIKNFMRPLREPVLREYLIEIAALPGSAPDPDCLIDFYLDQIRTHAFAAFTTSAAAARVRAALHGTVWPNESNRKELWVDFIPADKIPEWIDREQSEGGRGSSGRWEVRYEDDEDGNITATLVNAEVEPVRRNSVRQPPAPQPAPTGPARNSYPSVEGAPLGPRGRGANHFRQAPPPSAAAMSGGYEPEPYQTTRANPPLQYRPVSDEVAEHRLANISVHITKDRHRDLGLPDEINRYTFENGNDFVDRGKEAFIGIRPPHRERERRRLGIGRGNRGGAPPPRRRTPSPRRPSRDDDGYRGRGGDGNRYRERDDRRDDRPRDRFRDDVPRSRFDGQPLPTFGGGGGRGGRRGGGFGGGGGRRDWY